MLPIHPWPNKALQPTRVGHLSSAFAVHVIGPGWLSLGRRTGYSLIFSEVSFRMSLR